MKSSSTATSTPNRAAIAQPTQDEIRDYAFHLYQEGGHLHGDDVGYWHEAEACLRASIPKECTRMRMHHHAQITERAAIQLVKHSRS